MSSAVQTPSGWLARVGQWLHRLNRHRLARRRAARQRAVDRAWFVTTDPSQPVNARALQTRALAIGDGPLLSIVVLPEASSRVAAAAGWPWHGRLGSPWYERWEILLSDTADGPPADSRVRALSSDEHLTPAQRFAAAVRAARGEAVVVVPHDGLLAPHALLLLAEAMRRFPHWRVIYADHGSAGLRGSWHSPRMLCDWNLELLRSMPYLQGMIALRRDALLSHLDAEVTAAIHWRDLLFRMTESGDADAVIHIPHLLWYRWQPGRPHPDAPPPSATVDELGAVQAHLQRCKVAATALAAREGGVHVRYAVPDPAPLVSLIIPTRNGLALLHQCVQSIFERTRYPNYELVIVDNGSDDTAVLEYLRSLEKNRRVRVQRDDGPFNFSALNNAAARFCRGALLGLLNNDIEVISEDWLDEMAGLALRPDVGAVGARLWFPDDKLQHAGVLLGVGGVAGHAHHRLPRGEPGYLGRAVLTQEFSAVTAACMLLRREVFESVGRLDEKNLAVDYNDIDLCLRIRQAGYRIVWTPHAQLYHHESATRRATQRQPQQQQRYEREVRCMQQRWGSQLQRDPAYNPNLSLKATPFLLSAEPRVSLATRWFDA